MFRKVVLASAALAIGTSIWSMHFIGMLAVRLPIQIDYNILITLISALISILMTGVGLAFAVYGKKRRQAIWAGGVLMGLGISCMHYTGMAGIQANCTIKYNPSLLIGSVAVGIAASVLAVWIFCQRGRTWSLAVAALAMGLAIAGMHYTAMASAIFLPVEFLAANAQPVMQSSTLAFGVAVSTFLVVGFAVLCALPAAPRSEQPLKPVTAAAAMSGADSVAREKLPVELNKRRLLLDCSEIIAVKAEGHYTTVCANDRQYFCDLPISKVENMLNSKQFCRVHRSYIVNLSAVESFEKNGEQGILNLRTDDGLAVPSMRSMTSLIAGMSPSTALFTN